ncbi:MAG: hydrogenase formation protein HypD [Myxococcota bacterium]
MSTLPFVSEFRDPTAAKALVGRIHTLAAQVEHATFMEVCGTHTMAIYRHGIRQLLPPNVRLLSGPGCPVCVTPNAYLDRAVALARQPGFIITTFGDMMRVPGSTSSLQQERAQGADVRVVYSALDALDLARNEPSRQVVFLGVGFETTAPTVAATVEAAASQRVQNFSVLSAAKVIPPALGALVADPALRLDGFLCPGHVSVILGTEPYEPLAKDHRLPCVVAGFEALDVLQALMMLLEQRASAQARVEIAYRRAVTPQGNPVARKILDRVFEVSDSGWRGLGVLPASGLALRQAYRAHDAARFEVDVEPTREHPGCACGDILRGIKTPFDCKLFGGVCTPDRPQGACMVSSEGTCSAAFRYGREEEAVA